MSHHVVTWSIDIFDAESPRDAALKALAMMPRSTDNEDDSATIFDVVPCDCYGAQQPGEAVLIDISEPENEDE